MAKTLILYHGNCPDGFGGAYAAWKKFGDSAEYVAISHGRALPMDVTGRDVIFIDYCETKEFMDEVVAKAASVVVLDHHEGVEEVVKTMPTYVYDAERSGASIAWTYFFPDKPVPYFLHLVDLVDRFQMISDDDRAIVSYTYAQPFTFENWDKFVTELDSEDNRAAIIKLGRAYTEHFKLLVAQIATRAQLVSFEGHEVYFVSAPRLFATELGSYLRAKKPPFAMIARAEADGALRISLRGINGFDVSELARKYGGNGHPGSAAFSLPRDAALPWTPIPTDENTGD